MADEQIHNEPGEVEVVDGSVILKCPESEAVRMTPGAAEETSERLLEGAMKARGQRYFNDDKGD